MALKRDATLPACCSEKVRAGVLAACLVLSLCVGFPTPRPLRTGPTDATRAAVESRPAPPRSTQGVSFSSTPVSVERVVLNFAVGEANERCEIEPEIELPFPEVRPTEPDRSVTSLVLLSPVPSPSRPLFILHSRLTC
ncbi:MAG: hypothetical protein U0835_15670 [Isosphaeraceae bacterium]